MLKIGPNKIVINLGTNSPLLLYLRIRMYYVLTVFLFSLACTVHRHICWTSYSDYPDVGIRVVHQNPLIGKGSRLVGGILETHSVQSKGGMLER